MEIIVTGIYALYALLFCRWVLQRVALKPLAAALTEILEELHRGQPENSKWVLQWGVASGDKNAVLRATNTETGKVLVLRFREWSVKRCSLSWFASVPARMMPEETYRDCGKIYRIMMAAYIAPMLRP